MRLKNIGPIKQADFDLGDFTIVCGHNNTGKTCIARALFGLFPNAVRVDQFVNFSVERKKSFIAQDHPDILDDFGDIIDTVRPLLKLGFYLRHAAKKGDLLMMDEPESNLHPENQCQIARLFARLVNSGIKVFITTHSDYIIKELNTLIMLNHDRPHLKKIAREEGYKENELISADKIKVYVAEKDNTLTPAPLDPEFGMEVRSFDTIIDRMNRIQDAIVWGG